MNQKTFFKKCIYGLIIVLFFSLFLVWGLVHSGKKEMAQAKRNVERKFLLSDLEVAEKQLTYNKEDIALLAEVSDKTSPVLISVGETYSMDLTIQKAGTYHILAEYTWAEHNLFENPVMVSVNGETKVSSLPFLWSDTITDLRTDRYGNEIAPDQYRLEESSSSYLEDYEHFHRTPIEFHLSDGNNQISFTPQNQDIILYNVVVLHPSSPYSYEEYRNEYKDAQEFQNLISVEGEHYRAKSDSYIRGRNVPSTNVVPSDPYVKLINATDDKSNKSMGQKIIYEVDIPMDGIYYISFKYSQPLKTGASSYRTIEIDGKVPFIEARDVGFLHTGLDKYENLTLGGSEPMGIYLTKGVHTIALKVTAGKLDSIYRDLLAIVEEMNDTGILLKKIKGSNSDDTAKIDVNRTWDILQYMPDILSKLEGWQMRLTAIYDELEQIGGRIPSFASDLMLAAQNLERLAIEPREIPNRMSLLSDDSSSAAQLISLTLTKIYEQNLSIDRFYLHGKDYTLPSPKEHFLDKLLTDVKQFFYSFSPIMNETMDVSNSDGKLTIWINKPAQYVEALRELTAQEFTAKTDIDVIYSIMPDEKKITLANSTGTNPDIALGLSYYRPAEFAMRGMAKNLLEYEDFIDWYSKEYNLEALAPMAYEDGIYGASETQDFYVLFYRTDILDMLSLSVPETWDDVKKMMPILHRNAMNFNTPLANNVGYKSFEMTGGFIFQNNGNYYSEDGFHSNFNDPNTLKGLKEMTDLFLVYGLVQNVPNFFNAFRSGAVPIGISNFSTYLQLQVAAPELTGRWDIALIPGTVMEDGSVARYYSANATSAMIFANTKMEKEAYEFLKWWLSSETQVQYATKLQMKYGPDFIWNTANHTALNQMSYPREHKKLILEQWKWQKEVLRHPASYIIEREISNAWIDIVTGGDAFQPRIDEAALASNREMKRKLTEFGYYDENGNQLKDYNVHLIDELIAKQKQKAGGDNE